MQTWFFLMFIAYGLGTLAAMMGGRKSIGRWLVALGASAGAGAGLVLGATVIATGTSLALSVPELLPLGGGLALRLDALGAFFLVVIGVALIAEGFDWHVPRGYIYFAMAFSTVVEMLNIRMRKKAKPVKLHKPIEEK